MGGGHFWSGPSFIARSHARQDNAARVHSCSGSCHDWVLLKAFTLGPLYVGGAAVIMNSWAFGRANSLLICQEVGWPRLLQKTRGRSHNVPEPFQCQGRTNAQNLVVIGRRAAR